MNLMASRSRMCIGDGSTKQSQIEAQFVANESLFVRVSHVHNCDHAPRRVHCANASIM